MVVLDETQQGGKYANCLRNTERYSVDIQVINY